MTTTVEPTPTDTDDGAANMESQAQQLVQAIQQLRSEQGIAETEEIAIYVTNTQVVRSLLKQYSEQIEAQTHTADLVQVNVDGGIPMPEVIAHADFEIGGETVTIGISRA